MAAHAQARGGENSPIVFPLDACRRPVRKVPAHITPAARQQSRDTAAVGAAVVLGSAFGPKTNGSHTRTSPNAIVPTSTANGPRGNRAAGAPGNRRTPDESARTAVVKAP